MVRSVAIVFGLAVLGLGAPEQAALRLPNGSMVEVLGVCQSRGPRISCWDLKRRDVPALAKTVTLAIHTTVGGGGFVSVPGMKNRIVVVRESSRWGGDTVSLEWVWSRRNVPGFAYVPRLSSTSKRATTTVTARAIVMGPNERQTAIRVRVWHGIPSIRLPAKVGASFRMNGQVWTVRTIGKAPVEGAKHFGKPFERVWCIRMAFSGRAVPQSGVYPSLDKEMYADGKGNLSTPASRNAWRRDHPKGKSPFELVALSYWATTPHTVDIYLNADPRQLDGIRFGGTQNRTIDVGGIPLDPL